MEATGHEPSIAQAPLTLACTSTFWRNAWKYEARAYRHTYWDSGTVLANLLAVAAPRELPAKVVLGWVDGPVNRLLDVDPDREAAVALVPLGRSRDVPPQPPPVRPLGLPVLPLSARERSYPEILEMHAASSLGSGAEAAAWREGAPDPRQRRFAGERVPLRPIPEEGLLRDPIEAVIRRRGSTRRFARSPIGFEQPSTALERSVKPFPADFLDRGGTPLNGAYLIVNAVEGLAPGTYVLDPEGAELRLLRAGELREEAGRLALGQDLGADAAVNVYFLADLGWVLARYGNRGYRAAQLEAAINAGRLYLASYALGLGATGLTFFDDEVTKLFSPHAAGKSSMFLLALGVPMRRGRG